MPERPEVDYQALVLDHEPEAIVFRTDTGYEIRDGRNRKHRTLAFSPFSDQSLAWRRAWRHIRATRKRSIQ